MVQQEITSEVSTMPKSRILILDAQNINSLAFTRELGSRGYFVGSAGTSNFPLTFFSNYPMKKHVLPSYKKPNNIFQQFVI